MNYDNGEFMNNYTEGATAQRTRITNSPLRLPHKFTLLLACLITVISTTQVLAKDEPKTFKDALLHGDISINIRVRAELVDQDGFADSEAYTERLRLGYTTKTYRGFTFHVDVEDIRSFDDDRYNAAGLNSNGGKAVVADPEDTEINQAFVKYTQDGIEIIFGRQRIILDDARFVGNVGWRQNEQTFDAATIKGKLGKDVNVHYSYLWDINRIFGPDADRDFESNSHIINVSTGNKELKVTGFAYLLDFDNSAANSTDTFGVRVTGNNKVSDNTSVKYTVSYATQSEGDNSPLSYDADYQLYEVILVSGKSKIGAGLEILGEDGDGAGTQGSAFRTPLATLHKFNGWADRFLATPETGIEDFYVVAGTQLPLGFMGTVVYHWFDADSGASEYGEELDIALAKKINKNVKFLVKFADYNGKSGEGDRTKTWFQFDIVY